MDGDTSLAVLKCYSEHHGKEDNEQKWGQDTALFGAIGDIEVLRHLAILNNSRSHAFVEWTNDANEIRWAANPYQNVPESWSVDGVKGLGKVDENSIQFALLFTTLFLQLPSCKNHIHGAAVTPKATLALWKDVVVTDVFGETVENNVG